MKITAWVALVVRESQLRTAETKSMSADRLRERVSGPHVSKTAALAPKKRLLNWVQRRSWGLGSDGWVVGHSAVAWIIAICASWASSVGRRCKGREDINVFAVVQKRMTCVVRQWWPPR